VLKTIPATTFAIAISVSAASAQQATPAENFIAVIGLGVCSKQTDATKRLECFDKLATAARENVGKTADNSKKADQDEALPEGWKRSAGKWLVQTEKDRMDDSITVVAMLQTNEALGSGFMASKGSIYVRCARGKTDVLVNWGTQLAVKYGVDHVEARVRVNDTPAVKAKWSKSTNGSLAGLWGQREAAPFALMLANASALAVETEVFPSGSRIASFDLTGMAEAIVPVRAACKW
jgi:type VI secretion system protein VasI